MKTTVTHCIVVLIVMLSLMGCQSRPAPAAAGHVAFGMSAILDDKPLPLLSVITAESCSNGYGGISIAFSGESNLTENAIDDEVGIGLNVKIYDVWQLPLGRSIEVTNNKNIRVSGIIARFLLPLQDPLTTATGTITLSSLSDNEVSGVASLTFTDPNDVNGTVQDSVVLVAAFTNLAVVKYCTDPGVFFARPKDGETVSNPIYVNMMVTENFVVEPAGQVTPGHGHLHIMVNTDCVPVGQVIPNDETHLHYNKGEMEVLDLTLTPGIHRLCLQAADGGDTALDLTHEIMITVK